MPSRPRIIIITLGLVSGVRIHRAVSGFPIQIFHSVDVTFFFSFFFPFIFLLLFIILILLLLIFNIFIHLRLILIAHHTRVILRFVSVVVDTTAFSPTPSRGSSTNLHPLRPSHTTLLLFVFTILIHIHIFILIPLPTAAIPSRLSLLLLRLVALSSPSPSLPGLHLSEHL